MKFTIEYHTRWGENLVLRSAGKSWPMSYVPDGKWSVELPAEEFFDGEAEREYFYEVVILTPEGEHRNRGSGVRPQE